MSRSGISLVLDYEAKIEVTPLLARFKKTHYKFEESLKGLADLSEGGHHKSQAFGKASGDITNHKPLGRLQGLKTER